MKTKQSAAFDTDQAELHALRSGIASVSVGIRDELISEEAITLADESGIAVPKWEKAELGAEMLAGAALEVAGNRRKLLDGHYPFSIDRGAIRHSATADQMYEFCLTTSVAASSPKLEEQRLVRHFERVVRDLLVAFIGPDTVGVRFGWPSEKDLDRMTKGIVRKITWMKEACGFGNDEWTLDASERLEALRARSKDARIDVVVRRHFGDGRPGGLTLLGQCGCGRNDVDSSSRKHEELSENWLKHFFGRSSVPFPVFVFATSQHIVSNDDLYFMQSEARAIIFDRVRLTLLAKRCPEVVASHRTRMKSLIDSFCQARPSASNKAPATA